MRCARKGGGLGVAPDFAGWLGRNFEKALDLQAVNSKITAQDSLYQGVG